MICEKCGKEFFEDWRKDERIRKTPCRFCSRACSNGRKQTKEMNEARRIKLQKREKKYCSCGKKLSHNNRSGFCKNCRPPSKTAYQALKDFRRKRKEYLIKYKGGKCEICGYDKCVSALEFHHINPKDKSYALSNTGKRVVNRTLERDIEEVNKCILLCSNCHKEIHSNNVDIA